MFLGLAATLLILSLLGACVHSAVYVSRVEAAHPPQGDQIEVNGADVHVIRRGMAVGPPVLFIHGASANANEFTWTLAPLLDDRFDLLMADRPGHGYSERVENNSALGQQAAQMAGVLRHYRPGTRAVVVGHSFGGGVALRLALDYPELVQGLVLLAPVSHDWGGGGQAWYNQAASTPVLGSAFAQVAPIVGPGRLEDGVASTFHPAPVPDDYIERSASALLFRPGVFRTNARDVIALQEELGAQQNRYTELDMPIIVFSGAQDTVINPSLHVGRLKNQAQDLTLIPLPDGGHMPHHAHSGEIADAIARLAMPADAG